MLNIGQMRFNIIVKRLVKSQDEFGAEKKSYINHLAIKADLRTKNNSKVISNLEVFNTSTIVFWVHYRDILSTDRIVYNGNNYEILSIVEIGYKEGLELVVSKIND